MAEPFIPTPEMIAAAWGVLRDRGISRLFDMGNTLPEVAAVSGHRSWQSLQRYTHLSHTGDRFADWPWLKVVTEPVEERP